MSGVWYMCMYICGVCGVWCIWGVGCIYMCVVCVYTYVVCMWCVCVCMCVVGEGCEYKSFLEMFWEEREHLCGGGMSRGSKEGSMPIITTAVVVTSASVPLICLLSGHPLPPHQRDAMVRGLLHPKLDTPSAVLCPQRLSIQQMEPHSSNSTAHHALKPELHFTEAHALWKLLMRVNRSQVGAHLKTPHPVVPQRGHRDHRKARRTRMF